MEYAGKGTTALGVVGTVLGSIGTAGVLGGGNLFGLGGNQSGDNAPVNRYELAQESKIAKLEADIALRDANIYNDQKLNDLKNYVDCKFDKVNGELRDIAVYQATNTAAISCLGQQINGIQAVLGSITKTIVPNSAICPGWGNVTVAPEAAAATGA